MPFGFEGILHGAAIFFRSYFGFDVIVTKGNKVIVCPVGGLDMVWVPLGLRDGWKVRCVREGVLCSPQCVS